MLRICAFVVLLSTHKWDVVRSKHGPRRKFWCKHRCGRRSGSSLSDQMRYLNPFCAKMQRPRLAKGQPWHNPRITHADHGMCNVVRGILTILEGALVGKPNKRPGGQIERASHLDSRRDSPDLRAAASRSLVFGATVAPAIP